MRLLICGFNSICTGLSQRIKSDFIPRFDFGHYPMLTFEKPDIKVFRNLDLAFQALKTGGNMPCIMNAANEVAVDAFLHHKARFLQIPDIIEKVMSKITFISTPVLEDFQQSDREARNYAKALLNF